jgi:hypothetical protein
MSSPSDLIVNSKSFDASKIQYDAAKLDSRGGKRIKLKYAGNSLVLSIPLMFTWGVNERVDEATKRVSYDASIVFESGKSRGINKFLEGLKELQNKIIEDSCNEKCKEWFGKNKMSTEVAEAMMYPILKYPKNKETGEPDYTRDPSLRLKIPFWNDEFNVELYNMEGKAVFLPPKDNKDPSTLPQGDKTPVDIVPSKSYMKGLVACDGIWMAGGRYGITWKLLQAQVCPPVNLVGTGVCHIVADDDDDEIMGQIKDSSNEAKETEQTVNFSDGDDDDDDDDGAKEEAPEDPPPKPKKKVVKRKAKA